MFTKTKQTKTQNTFKSVFRQVSIATSSNNEIAIYLIGVTHQTTSSGQLLAISNQDKNITYNIPKNYQLCGVQLIETLSNYIRTDKNNNLQFT